MKIQTEAQLQALFNDVLNDMAEKTKKTWAYMEPEEGETLRQELAAKLENYRKRFYQILREERRHQDTRSLREAIRNDLKGDR